MPEVKTFCRVCEPSCGLTAVVEQGQIVSLKPDKHHPITQGFACHKGLATLDIHRDPDRLSYPEKRSGEGFERLSWDQASQEIAGKIAAIRDKYGDQAIGSYTGNPLAFNTLASPAIGSFFVKNKIRRNFSSGTQDCTNKFAGSEAIFGSSTIHPVPDIENTDFLLIFGANPRISHMSFLSIADPMKVLRKAEKRGADIRFVDPRRNETVKGIGRLHQLRPDTDIYLMAAMIHHIDIGGKFDEPYLALHGDRVDELRKFVAQFDADTVADVVGLAADEIRDLADAFAAANSAAVYMSTGINMGRQGTLAYWLMYMLSVVTGNFDKPGGNYYSLGFYPAAKAGKVGDQSPFFDNEFGELRKIRGALPGNLMADMILDAAQPIKAMIVISGNPLISVGHSERMKKAFASLELLVVIDIYPNATAHLADYVLPATDMYEREDINLCGLGMQHQPFVQYTDFIVPPAAERKPEWWILAKIEQAQGFDSILDSDDNNSLNLFGRTDHMLRHVGSSIEELKSADHPTLVLPKTARGQFYTDWIQTESGRIDCCPDLFAEALLGCASIFKSLAEDSGQLKMISRRTNYMVNSWFHNVASLKRKDQLDNPLYMHPEDARSRNLGEGSTASIFNDNGSLQARIKLDEDLKPGVVAMTHGWGNGKTRMRTASKHAGVNANILLPSGPGSYEKLSNQAFMTGIPVSILAVESASDMNED